eukprot:SM000259S08741  [mRNA]  locus=s259:65087:65409:+ [translate_table: standard]
MAAAEAAAAAPLADLGRHLSCPICLGLLRGAVLLACNHCFCGCAAAGLRPHLGDPPSACVLAAPIRVG